MYAKDNKNETAGVKILAQGPMIFNGGAKNKVTVQVE